MSKKTFSLTASSQMKADTLADFLSGSVEEDLKSVPGIGPAGVTKLREAGIETTHALIGKYLTLRKAGQGCKEHMDVFYEWLADTGIASHRAGIALAIAEKVNTWIPGLFDEAAFVEEEGSTSK